MLITYLLIGVVSGWLAGTITRGRGFGCFGNLIVGIIGAMLGGYVFRILDIHIWGSLGTIAMSVVGAVIFLGLISFFKNDR